MTRIARMIYMLSQCKDAKDNPAALFARMRRREWREFSVFFARFMGGASARQLQSRCKMYSCFCKSRKMYIQPRVPTYNHNYFVLHCCFGFPASARNDVTARASSWLVNAARISAKVQIFQLARRKRPIRAIRAASFARIAPPDFLSRLCIDLTCKSFARFTSFASGVNAPLRREWRELSVFFARITECHEFYTFFTTQTW